MLAARGATACLTGKSAKNSDVAAGGVARLELAEGASAKDWPPTAALG